MKQIEDSSSLTSLSDDGGMPMNNMDALASKAHQSQGANVGTNMHTTNQNNDQQNGNDESSDLWIGR